MQELVFGVFMGSVWSPWPALNDLGILGVARAPFPHPR